MIGLVRGHLRAIFLALAAFLCAGCSAPPQAPVEQTTISKLGVFYGRYSAQNKGQAPGSEQDLKDFIRKVDSKADVDQLFVSPRDKEPYVVKYKATKTGGNVAVHEKTGVEGKKMVALITGEVRTVDEEEFRKLTAR